jgi:hypothetical protein
MEEGISTSGIVKRLLMKMITGDSRSLILFLLFEVIYPCLKCRDL